MRFYLSSFELGELAAELPGMYGTTRPVGCISNALDHVTDTQWRADWTKKEIESLANLGLSVRELDLRDWFGEEDSFEELLHGLSGIWVTGGNVFVLRQAMRLSGLDDILRSDRISADFVYGGYSAGCCVLSPTLRPYSVVDDPNVRPYAESPEIIWDGLGLLDFAYMPHFQSEHAESQDIEREIAICDENGLPYRAFRDGQVLVL